MNQELSEKRSPLLIAVALSILLVAGAALYRVGGQASPKVASRQPAAQNTSTSSIGWSGLSRKLTESGVLDREKFLALARQRGSYTEALRLLDGDDETVRAVTPKTAGLYLNLLWGFGLGNQNSILISGPMSDPRFGGAGGFASTGGWTLSGGSPMDHYAAHPFLVLSAEEQEFVERASKSIFRPCCDNPAHFPDCNHGMAMLGLLELLARSGMSEDEIYRAALQANELWFPDEYAAIRAYTEQSGVRWGDADPRVLLGSSYSSGSGFTRIADSLQSSGWEGEGGGCSV